MEAKFTGGDNFDLLTGPSPEINPLFPGTIISEASAGGGPRIFSRHFDDSSSSSTASDDDEDDQRSSTASMESTAKRLDYMLQFLDRKLSSASPATASHAVTSNSGLPEFIGRGGGTGIFKLPPRAAVHPGRPPSLDVRPHPLRETQIGCFLRTIATTPNHLWAGGERSLRVWDLNHDLYSACNLGEDAELDTAPFRESVVGISPTLCMASDEANHLVWSGHQDGRIRCWKMPPSGGRGIGASSAGASSKTRFREALCWQAHRGPILCIAMSSDGDLWSGSEGGSIKIWPWEAVERSLSLTEDERHIAVTSIERSYIEPHLNGFANSLGADVKHLLSDHSKGRMWSANYFSFALWDARSRELLRMFNTDGQVENRTEVVLQDLPVDLPFGAKKDKGPSPIGFLQRSRNAIMGAADAVRRAATKGAFGDDNRKTEALVSTIDGMIWTGCTSGLLVQWDGNGNRLQDVQYLPFPVQCLCSFGLRIWVGYANGTIQVLDLEGNLIGSWTAHSGSVMKLTIGSGYVFSLASHGGIRGWNVTSPSPLDGILRTELGGKEFLYSRIENVKILAGTWNVGQGRASRDSLIAWLGSAASSASIVVVGLQEVDMGAGFLAMSAAKETVGLEGSAAGQWWLDMIGKTLDEGSTFERVGSRQLAGLLVAVWLRKSLRPHAGDADAAAVPCGFGRAIGNKGAVGLRIRVYDRIICFINCHFAAHVEAVTRRNADFDHVYRTMTFSKPSNSNGVAAGASSAVQMLRGVNVIGTQSVEGLPELSEADMIIFLGDFNYRLDGISYDEARDFISQRCFDWLREKDQLRAEMEAGNVFQGMRESIIKFPPTYKFERHLAGLAGYDAGEKKRIPAWCDRILYRDSRSPLLSDCSLDCPVVASISEYEACMEVTDSDHKPVRCMFSVDIARVDESVRRQEFGEVIKSNGKVNTVLDRLFEIPDTIVSTNNIIIQNEDTSILRITNKSKKDNALFQIICDGVSVIKEDCQAAGHHPRGSFGFPPWLEVSPVSGMIDPDHTVEVFVRHEKFQTLEEFVDGVPQNGWCEDTRDKEVILVIRVSGAFMTRTKCHRVRVRHCSTERTKQVVVKPSPDSMRQPQTLQRSDIQRLSDSYDVVEHLRNLHSP